MAPAESAAAVAAVRPVEAVAALEDEVGRGHGRHRRCGLKIGKLTSGHETGNQVNLLAQDPPGGGPDMANSTSASYSDLTDRGTS